MSFNMSSGDGMVMPVAPMNSYSGNDGFGWGGNGAWWLLVLFLFAMNGNGFGWGNNAGGMAPYMMANNTNNDVQRGFDQQAVMSGLNGINAGIAGLGNSLCNGFAGVTAAVNQGFASSEIANNARQIADLQQQFALQTQLA